MADRRLILDLSHRNALLAQVFQLALTILLVGFIASVFLFSSLTVTGILLAATLIGCGDWLRRRGHYRSARSLLLCVMLLLIGALATIGEGTDDAVILFMAPVMMLTGVITSRREFWLYACGAGAIYLLLALGEHLGWIHSNFSQLPERQQIGEPFVLLLAHIATCALIDLMLHRIGSFVGSVRDELEQESISWHQAAMTDPLTGLLNRRGLLDHADWQLQRAALERTPVALMVLDVDHFKQINDRFGHDIGDRVLQDMARLLKQYLRANDACARLGGEEFCALLTGIHREGAIAVAERFRIALAEGGARVTAGNRDDGDANAETAIGVTVSIGLSISLEGRLNIKDLLQEADQALYQAKRSGRNRVIVAGSSSEQPA